MSEKNIGPGETVSSTSSEPSPYKMVTMTELMNSTASETRWLVDELLPVGGISILTGKPKTGKSTLSRQLASCVASGQPFLGRAVEQAPVVYLPLEEKLNEVSSHFCALGATESTPISIMDKFATEANYDGLFKEVAKRGAKLLVADPLFRFLRVKTTNDYQSINQALAPLVALARETGIHLLCVHHLGKGSVGSPDAILGSTAIFAAVDTAFLLREQDSGRIISTHQRYGIGMGEKILNYDSKTRSFTLGGSPEQMRQEEMGKRILEFVSSCPLGATEKEINQQVQGKTQLLRTTVRRLLADGGLRREGGGTRNDPYRYFGTDGGNQS